MNIRKGLSFFRRFFSPKFSFLFLSFFALAFFITGLLIRNSLLQGLGGVVGATALSLFITIVTSREAVSQQNAKETNIARKDAYYIPMFNDLKQVYDALEDAKQKKLPYPQFIKGMGTGSEIRSYVWAKYPMPTFTIWTTFKEPPYRSNFTEKACRLFDEVQKAGADYNKAAAEAKDPVIKIINPLIDKAFRKWANTDEFKYWQEETKNGNIVSSSRYQQWNSYIQGYLQRTDSSAPEAYAIVWAHNVLGWILADDIDKASNAMQRTYQNDFHTYITPDTSWFKDILEDVWTELQELPSVKEVSKSVGELYIRTDRAKDYMQERLNYLRDMYEGGEPPL